MIECLVEIFSQRKTKPDSISEGRRELPKGTFSRKEASKKRKGVKLGASVNFLLWQAVLLHCRAGDSTAAS